MAKPELFFPARCCKQEHVCPLITNTVLVKSSSLERRGGRTEDRQRTDRGQRVSEHTPLESRPGRAFGSCCSPLGRRSRCLASNVRFFIFFGFSNKAQGTGMGTRRTRSPGERALRRMNTDTRTHGRSQTDSIAGCSRRDPSKGWWDVLFCPSPRSNVLLRLRGDSSDQSARGARAVPAGYTRGRHPWSRGAERRGLCLGLLLWCP